MESLNSNSQERELHQLQLEERQIHSNGMTCFKRLKSHLSNLYQDSFVHVRRPSLNELAFRTFFGNKHTTFRKKMIHKIDQLRLQFERENLHKVNANTCLQELRIQFMEFFASEEVNSLDRMNQIMQENFKDYLGSEHEIYRSHLLVHLDILEKFIDESVLNYGELLLKESEVKVIKETEKLLNEAIPHEHEIEKSFKLHAKNVQYNSVQAVHESLVVTESSGIKSENNNSENALNKSGNETQMQMQEGKVDM
ncbi:hypothetical protein Tco_1516008, partial [Tanacetum coccineum]